MIKSWSSTSMRFECLGFRSRVGHTAVSSYVARVYRADCLVCYEIISVADSVKLQSLTCTQHVSRRQNVFSIIAGTRCRPDNGDHYSIKPVIYYVANSARSAICGDNVQLRWKCTCWRWGREKREKRDKVEKISIALSISVQGENGWGGVA